MLFCGQPQKSWHCKINVFWQRASTFRLTHILRSIENSTWTTRSSFSLCRNEVHVMCSGAGCTLFCNQKLHTFPKGMIFQFADRVSGLKNGFIGATLASKQHRVCFAQQIKEFEIWPLGAKKNGKVSCRTLSFNDFHLFLKTWPQIDLHREELGTAFQPRIFGIASGIKIGLFIKYHSHLAFLIHHTPRTTKCFPQFSKDI